MAALGRYLVFIALSICSMLNNASNTQCHHPSGTNYHMSYDARDLILDMHNRKRQATAQGLYNNGCGCHRIPKAANILEMKYDCALEESAHAVASACSVAGTPEAELTKVNEGENFYVINTEYELLGSKTIAVSRAAEAWFEEITKTNINYHMLYNANFKRRPKSPKRWSQMVWANSFRIGCEIGDCKERTIVVCRYSPKGNVYGQRVYQPGPAASACKEGPSSSYPSLCNFPIIV
ncbi:unnamed protein product [Cylicocyclus nassatus]|uniref:SCP domain-containing protein n=1 Tax=Cylicocyclus nassatus TaxID=53992 RepID=A0AA36GDB7_CYLNA|nr:unnamed protein product [Cylicocyclus nassatus]